MAHVSYFSYLHNYIMYYLQMIYKVTYVFMWHFSSVALKEVTRLNRFFFSSC